MSQENGSTNSSILQFPTCIADMEHAFPDVNPGVEPLGSRVLVQVRRPKNKTKGGIILSNETKDTDKWNTMVGKVIAVGPLAFHNRTDLTQWPEGAWCAPGDFVRIPKWGGDRWEVDYKEGEDPALFVICNDHEIIGKIKPGFELKLKAFI